jgi:hypothetical protein
MTGLLVRRRIEAAGLLPFVEDRGGALAALGPKGQRLVDRADLVALGAAADLTRRWECGTQVRLHVPVAPAGLAVPSVGSERLLRHVAAMRLLGREGLRIGIDCDRVGIPIALVALGFGATDLVGSTLIGRRSEIEREVIRLGYELGPAGPEVRAAAAGGQ